MPNSALPLIHALAVATLLATGVPATTARAQGAKYDRTLELPSFDTAWTRVRDSYYDASMRGLNWLAFRDSLRPLVKRGDPRDDTRAAITTLLSRLREAHF